MKKTKVRSYTDKELLDKVKSLPTFKGFPKDYWILGVQSLEDTFNTFDDKFYVFKGEKFIMVTSGTTNSGSSGLLNYMKYKLSGTAIWKTNIIYYGLLRGGLHKGKMKALRMVKAIYHYRDTNLDKKSDEVGPVYFKNIYANFHFNSYKRGGIKKWLIGGWSLACQVCNDEEDYYKIIDLCYGQDETTYCLIKEF